MQPNASRSPLWKSRSLFWPQHRSSCFVPNQFFSSLTHILDCSTPCFCFHYVCCSQHNFVFSTSTHFAFSFRIRISVFSVLCFVLYRIAVLMQCLLSVSSCSRNNVSTFDALQNLTQLQEHTVELIHHCPVFDSPRYILSFVGLRISPSNCVRTLLSIFQNVLHVSRGIENRSQNLLFSNGNLCNFVVVSSTIFKTNTCPSQTCWSWTKSNLSSSIIIVPAY